MIIINPGISSCSWTSDHCAVRSKIAFYPSCDYFHLVSYAGCIFIVTPDGAGQRCKSVSSCIITRRPRLLMRFGNTTPPSRPPPPPTGTKLITSTRGCIVVICYLPALLSLAFWQSGFRMILLVAARSLNLTHLYCYSGKDENHVSLWS